MLTQVIFHREYLESATILTVDISTNTLPILSCVSTKVRTPIKINLGVNKGEINLIPADAQEELSFQPLIFLRTQNYTSLPPPIYLVTMIPSFLLTKVATSQLTQT